MKLEKKFKLAYALFLSPLVFANIACDGGMEEAGEDADEMVEDAGEAVEDATDGE